MDLISRLRAAHERTLPFFDLSEADLERQYAPDKWSVRFILHHLADTETVLYDRIRRVISEPRQVIWAFDQDAWAARLEYASFPLAVSQRIFSAVREAVIHQARAHYEENGHLEFIHSEVGVRTLRDEFEKVAWHNERHLTQIEDALAQSRARPPRSAP